MAKPRKYFVARCPQDRECKKCGSIEHGIVIRTDNLYNIHCFRCGAYIKHASVEDKRHTYLEKVSLTEGMALGAIEMMIESEFSMTTK